MWIAQGVLQKNYNFLQQEQKQRKVGFQHSQEMGLLHTAQSGATQNVVFDAYSVGVGASQRWYPKVPSGITIQIGSTTYNAGDNISVADTTTIFGAYGVNTRNVAWTNGGNASYYGASAGNQNVNPSATNVSPYIFWSYQYQFSSPNCRYYGARFRSDGGIEFIIYYREYVDDEYGAYCGNIQSTQVETGVISSITAVNINVTSGASTYDPVKKIILNTQHGIGRVLVTYQLKLTQ